MKKSRAFSLLEMLITLLSIGILLAMSYPSYTQYFLRQKRFAAEVTLLKLATALDHFYNEHNSYQQATLNRLGFDAKISESYLLAIELANDIQYTVTAEPINSQSKDATCGKLSLSSTGEKNSSDTGAVTDCW